MQYPVMLDKPSEFLMVEQCGFELYKIVAERAITPELKQKYQEFGGETARQSEVLVRLIERLGGDPSYISPPARVAQFKAGKLLESALAVDGLSQPEIEINDLENVLLAETKDHADWHLAKQLASPSTMAKLQDATTQALGMMPSGLSMVDMQQAIQAAVDEVEDEEDEHLSWARDTSTRMCLEMAMNGPAPSPERWQRIISSPFTPIEQLHPAPMSVDPDLLPLSQEPMWQESPAVRAVQAADTG
jgi:hypothetical protein